MCILVLQIQSYRTELWCRLLRTSHHESSFWGVVELARGAQHPFSVLTLESIEPDQKSTRGSIAGKQDGCHFSCCPGSQNTKADPLALHNMNYPYFHPPMKPSLLHHNSGSHSMGHHEVNYSGSVHRNTTSWESSSQVCAIHSVSEITSIGSFYSQLRSSRHRGYHQTALHSLLVAYNAGRHFSFLTISLKTILVFQPSFSVALFSFSLSIVKRVSMTVLSFTEFDFLISDSEFSISDSGLWLIDFRLWFATYMMLNWCQTFMCGRIQILEEIIPNVWNLTASPTSVPNKQNSKKSECNSSRHDRHKWFSLLMDLLNLAWSDSQTAPVERTTCVCRAFRNYSENSLAEYRQRGIMLGCLLSSG